MSTGLKRSSVASFTKSTVFTVGNFLRSSSMNDTKTIPLSMAMAKMAIKPTMAETER